MRPGNTRASTAMFRQTNAQLRVSTPVRGKFMRAILHIPRIALNHPGQSWPGRWKMSNFLLGKLNFKGHSTSLLKKSFVSRSIFLDGEEFLFLQWFSHQFIWSCRLTSSQLKLWKNNRKWWRKCVKVDDSGVSFPITSLENIVLAKSSYFFSVRCSNELFGQPNNCKVVTALLIQLIFIGCWGHVKQEATDWAEWRDK